ncbi:MAG TPA: YjbQ family protein [Candidatus Pacearchaeota archaeon]|nr:YjbQ family protein [Candidatus Pacearchaeota archaeon]
MMEILKVKTRKRKEVVDITADVERIVSKSNVKEGICFLFVPHATAALTINESADPNIKTDFLESLEKLIPDGIWRHDRIDNNGAAHLKSAIIKPDLMIPIKDSRLLLGTWQAIMLCEFDGPRERKIYVSFLK